MSYNSFFNGYLLGQMDNGNENNGGGCLGIIIAIILMGFVINFLARWAFHLTCILLFIFICILYSNIKPKKEIIGSSFILFRDCEKKSVNAKLKQLSMIKSKYHRRLFLLWRKEKFN